MMNTPKGQSVDTNPIDANVSLQSQTLGLGELKCAGEIQILILDDEEDTCKLITHALAHKDFVIESLSDPARVKAWLETAHEHHHKYHLIILDYVLPGLEPEDVLAWLRDYQPDAIVIVITGYPSVDSALNCLRARTYDYLTKPFQINQLRQVVLRGLESKGLLRMSEDALREALGAAIRDRRKALGLTLNEMAKKTGVSLGYLSQIELGKNSASIETLYKICLALGVRMAELFEAVQRPQHH
jgi:DNA-binding response OmpR family regulator